MILSLTFPTDALPNFFLRTGEFLMICAGTFLLTLI